MILAYSLTLLAAVCTGGSVTPNNFSISFAVSPV